MKKKKILNICMAIMAVLVVLCGVVAVGSVKGWFGNKQNVENEISVNTLSVSQTTGIAMIERSGVSYEVEEGTTLRTKDKLYTKLAATITITDNSKERVYLDANSEIFVNELNEGISLEVLQGECMIDARDMSGVSVIVGTARFKLDGSVASVSNQAGADMVSVYAGEVVFEEEANVTVKSGENCTILDTSDSYEVDNLKAESLSAFIIEKLKSCSMDETFCFSEKEIDQVVTDRETETMKAQQEALQSSASDDTISDTTTSNTTTSETTGSGTSSSGNNSSDSANSNQNKENDNKKYCTIQIRCDTILNHLDNLTPRKEGYVPANGVILATSTLAFTDGETVFDVLQRACSMTGIQLEYAYTPLYESYYIEGINHIYEFDCGSQSGWMYKVNGWYPNYGCSSYKLQDGDVIVWSYTCEGLGADL